MAMILFIYGASGAGKEIYDLANRINRKSQKYEKIIFIDDFQPKAEFYGAMRIPFSSCDEYANTDSAEFVIAVGEPETRKKLYNKVKEHGYKFSTLIDDTVLVSDSAKISEGCIIYAGAIISSDAVLKENCLVMFDAIIGHDATVEHDCVICPQATIGGNCNVGECTFVGIGSSIIQKIDIGKKVIIGMGAKVFREVPDGAVVVGNPARITKGNEEHKVFS